MSTYTAADAQAVIASLSTVDPATVRLDHIADGQALVIADTTDGHTTGVLMPALRSSAPARVRRMWWDRATASLTGRCPRCDGAAGLSPTSGRFELRHECDCPVIDEASLRKWIA